jgi:hypothetical protein
LKYEMIRYRNITKIELWNTKCWNIGYVVSIGKRP